MKTTKEKKKLYKYAYESLSGNWHDDFPEFCEDGKDFMSKLLAFRSEEIKNIIRLDYTMIEVDDE